MAAGARLDDPEFFEREAARMEGDVNALVLATALKVVTRARIKMAVVKHGRVYRVGTVRKRIKVGGRLAKQLTAAGFRSKTDAKGRAVFSVGARIHRASAPGEAPAVDTGNLTNSGYVKMIGKGRVEIGFTADYAAVLEYGGAHMAPRPFLWPSLIEEQEEFLNQLRRIWR